MLLVRDVFRCKPGKAKDLAARFKSLLGSMETNDNFSNGRVMVDLVASYWTVVLEAEVRSLADFERHVNEWGGREEVQKTMAGYMDLVEGGHREIYRIL